MNRTRPDTPAAKSGPPAPAPSPRLGEDDARASAEARNDAARTAAGSEPWITELLQLEGSGADDADRERVHTAEDTEPAPPNGAGPRA